MQYVLMGINGIILVALLAMSGIMFYFSLSNQGTIFGHTALIYTTFNQDNSEKHSLYIIKSGDRSVNVGDEIAFFRLDDEWNSVPCVDTVTNITSSIAEMRDVDEMFELNSTDYIGRVTAKNHALGEKLYSFTTSKLSMTLYVVFGGGFVLLSLVVILLIAMRTKRNAIMSAIPNELDDIIELSILEDDAEPDSLAVDKIASPDIKPDDFKDVLGEITADNTAITIEIDEPGNTIEIDIPPIKTDRSAHSKEIDVYLDEIIRNAQKDFEKTYSVK